MNLQLIFGNFTFCLSIHECKCVFLVNFGTKTHAPCPIHVGIHNFDGHQHHNYLNVCSHILYYLLEAKDKYTYFLYMIQNAQAKNMTS